MEKWKDVKGYEGLYQVSDLGRIKSLPRKRIKDNNLELIVKSVIHHRGYERVQLSTGGVSRNEYIHRIVAESFIPNPEKKSQVNHIDGNKLNNRSDNLEWSTPEENVIHAYRILKRPGSMKGRYGDKHNRSKNVFIFDRYKNLVLSFGSATQAAEFLKVKYQTLTERCSKESTIEGFTFSYRDLRESINFNQSIAEGSFL